jgi:Putative restriction endonuclease
MAERKPDSDLPRTLAEFEAWHARQPEQWEFIGGHPVMMAPGSLPHPIIKTNIGRHLGNELAGSGRRTLVDGCEVNGPGRSVIPGIVVTCNPLELATPIDSLRHYLVVAQDSRFAMLHTRAGPASFEERVYQDGAIKFVHLGITLSLDENYEDVTFEAPVADG